VLLAKEPLLRDGALILSGSPFRNYRIARDQLVEIRSEDAVDVLTLAWAKVNNAPPEKRAMLQASVANVGRALELRAQLQTHEFKLQEAMKLLAKAEATKADSTAKRQRVMQDWRRLQDVWRQKNREYWKAHSNNIRMASKVRTQRSAVDRAKRTLNNSQRTLDKYNQKLEKFENDILKGNIKVKDKKEVRRRRESYLRPIRRAEKSMQKAHQQLAETQRDDKKIQVEVKPLPLKEKVAKETLDQSKKDTDQAMVAYRRTIADYQAASRQAGIARGKVAELQQKKDQATQELEKLRSIGTAPESNK
jgi:chromosome segregation ATPase